MLRSIRSYLLKLKPSWLSLPASCLLCLTSIRNQTIALCDDCLHDLPSITLGCKHCNLPLPYDGICGQCLQSPPIFFKAVTPFRYDFPIAKLITLFKHHRQWPTGYLLSQLLCQHLARCYDQGLEKPNYLIAVPLSHKRLRQRSFNQADMIVKWLSKELGIAYQTGLIQRVIDTPSQQRLTAKERYKNLTNAFTVNPQVDLSNLHLAIVDDVITTASTANIVAELLYKQGAKRIDVYAIARTPNRIK